MGLDKNMEYGSQVAGQRVPAPCYVGTTVMLRAPGVVPFKVQVMGISDDGRKITVRLLNGDNLVCSLTGTRKYRSPWGDEIVFS